MVVVPESLEDRARIYDLFLSAMPRISEGERELVQKYGVDFLATHYDEWKTGLHRRAHMINDKTSPVDLTAITILEDTPVDDDITIREEIERIGGGMLVTKLETLYQELFVGLDRLNKYKKRIGLALVILSRALINLYLEREK